MGQGQGQEAAAGTVSRALSRGFIGGLLLSGLLLPLLGGNALAQINPFSALGRVVTTTMDVRSKDEVKADTEISAGASKRLLDDKGSEWAGVTVLVFARQVVLAGAVKNDTVKKRVEEVVRRDKNIRGLKNELLTGDVGQLVKDTAREAEINASLTAAKGISSVNMRWSSTGGRVVLMGVAQSQKEADSAVQKIRAIGGVKNVKSHLIVREKK
jgi:osmotically-inducible protein OsmY